MRIEALCEVFEREAFPLRDLDLAPERSSVQAARSEVGKAVIDDEFLAQCIGLELARLREGRMGPGLVPFYTMPRTGIAFGLGCWPPGGSPGPHEHTAWAITAVCRNQLDVLTFDRLQSYETKTLVPKNRFHAEAGQVGYIYEPCLHEPKNNSQDWSLSLHVYSPWDGRPVGDFEDCLPLSRPPRDLDLTHPYAAVISCQHRHTIVSALAHTLASMKTAAARNLLDECFAMAAAPTRRWLTGLGINGCEKRPLAPPTFQKTNPALTMLGHDEGDMIALHVDTGRGIVEQLAVGIKAREAFEFILRENRFVVGALPGGLTEDEQNTFAEALEDTGLFARLNDDLE